MLAEGLRAGLGHLGVKTRTVCYVEREAHAASVLAARIEEGSLDPAPVWSDMLTFVARAWHGAVDCVAAGFPCQDLSLAGRRAGLDGKRSGLFFNVLDIADACGAWLLVLENVAGIASATASVVDEASASDYAAKPSGDGFSDVGIEDGRLLERAAARVVGELADRGWHAEWITLSASDVGASHGRSRWFCIAWRMADAEHGTGSSQHEHEQRGRPAQGPNNGAELGSIGQDSLAHASGDGGNGPHREGWRGRGVCKASDELADTPGWHGRQLPRPDQRGLSEPDGGAVEAAAVEQPSCFGRQERRSEPEGQQGRPDAAFDGCAMANTCSSRQQGHELGRACACNGGGQEAYGPASQLRGLFAPGPADPRWAGILADHPELAPALEPTFRSVVDGVAFSMGDSRAARLKCVGNGVVALCAAVAFVELVRRARKGGPVTSANFAHETQIYGRDAA